MVNIDELAVRVRTRRRTLDAMGGEMRATLLRGKELQGEVAELGELIEDLDRVTVLLNSLGEERQLKAQATIEELVTRGLQTIFDSTLSFHIVQTVKGKSAHVEFVVRTTVGNEVIETPIMEARGGGLAAVVGFLLRLVVLLLTRGTKTESVLVLDESFSHVSAEYLPNVSEFLREIVDKTGVQVIMVTHQDELVENADKVYRFTNESGRTVVTEVV